MKNEIDYNKWQNWSWQSEDRYYLLSLTQNLFNEWVITKKWGGRKTRIHGCKTQYCKELNHAIEIATTFAQTHKKRLSRGYTLKN